MGASAEALLVPKGLEAGNPFLVFIIRRMFTVGGLAKSAGIQPLSAANRNQAPRLVNLLDRSDLPATLRAPLTGV